MMAFLAARRGPLALIALYVGTAIYLIALQLGSWADANAHQEDARNQLRILQANMPTGALGKGKPSSFAAASETQAIAEFDAYVRSSISQTGGTVISSRSEQKADPSAENAIAISLSFDGDIKVAQSAIYALEAGSPAVYIASAEIGPSEGETISDNPVLHVSLSLTSRWRQQQ